MTNFSDIAKSLAALQAEIDAAGMGDPCKAENDRLRSALLMWIASCDGQRKGYEDALNDARERIAHLEEMLYAHGPYCPLHGELQPCSQHRWIREPE